MNKKRLYFFVMYNISPIQAGIQAGHAALEYVEKYGTTPEYRDFIKNHKTFILLSGGGSIDMEEREKELEALGIPFASFQEPDLNNSVSAIAFLVEDDAYNYVKIYGEPSFEEVMTDRDYAIYDYLKSFKLAAN